MKVIAIGHHAPADYHTFYSDTMQYHCEETNNARYVFWDYVTELLDNLFEWEPDEVHNSLKREITTALHAQRGN